MEYQKKTYLLNEKADQLDPDKEILGLNILLESVLKEENYEMAVTIRNRLEQIYLELNIKNNNIL